MRRHLFQLKNYIQFGRRNEFTAVLFFIILLAIQAYFLLFSDAINYTDLNFGAEYGRVASSIYQNNGYGNVWGDSGPTAAVSPFLVYLIVVSFKLFGFKSITSYLFLTFVKHLSLGLSFYLIQRTIDLNKSLVSRRKSLHNVIYLIIWIIFIYFSPSQNFVKNSDLWISTFILSLFIYTANLFFISRTKKGNLLLILSTLFLPIINPSIALASFMSFSFIFLYYFLLQIKTSFLHNSSKKENNYFYNIKNKLLIRKYIVFTFAFLFFIGVWSIRNFSVFYKFIPTKSNSWLEFYLANVIDTDGQLSLSTSYRNHPISRPDLKKELKEMGEIKWLENYHKLSKQYLKSNNREYLQKIKVRLFNALIFIENDMDIAAMSNYHKISHRDKDLLLNEKLILGNQWICFFYNEQEINEILKEIGISDVEFIINDWKASKNIYHSKSHSIPNIIRGLSMSLIPLICIFIILFNSRIRNNLIFIIPIIIYFIYLLPYVMISHQIRYQRPLFVLQIIFIYLLYFLISDQIKSIIPKKTLEIN